MSWFSSNKLYQKVFRVDTVDVRKIRVQLTFSNGDVCFLTVEGRLDSSIKESNPLDNKYHTTSYNIVTAREAFHNFISNTTDWIVSEEDEYFNLNELKIRKVKILKEEPNQSTISVFVGLEEVGDKSE